MVRLQVDYHKYMASREWALKKEEVKERAGGICERCHDAPLQSTHHLTYERLGGECVDTDLLGLCNPCHKYLSGKSETDPATQVVRLLIEATGLVPSLIRDGDWSSLMEWSTGPTRFDHYFHGSLKPTTDYDTAWYGDYMDGAHLVIQVDEGIWYHCDSY